MTELDGAFGRYPQEDDAGGCNVLPEPDDQTLVQQDNGYEPENLYAAPLGDTCEPQQSPRRRSITLTKTWRQTVRGYNAQDPLYNPMETIYLS